MSAILGGRKMGPLVRLHGRGVFCVFTAFTSQQVSQRSSRGWPWGWFPCPHGARRPHPVWQTGAAGLAVASGRKAGTPPGALTQLLAVLEGSLSGARASCHAIPPAAVCRRGLSASLQLRYEVLLGGAAQAPAPALQAANQPLSLANRPILLLLCFKTGKNNEGSGTKGPAPGLPGTPRE